ncbi:hypothetical protein TNCT_65221 [Trichonephila clavata]|uniref:Integrase catalytic domain-containing protein n=1 Tax=Trichonephila clavata TaxID=2740835 RepID=A0A8X6LG83_TRICU|nr:hypothetical protein TNCT_65221 [Trichonephila clavata]
MSDNGREFSNNVVNSLKEFLSALQIVMERKHQHSQYQGSVERVNQDIELCSVLGSRPTSLTTGVKDYVSFNL